MSGIINIVLHKNSNLGFNASVNTGVTQGENTRLNGSIDMNFKTGKVNFFANYGYNDGVNDNFGKVARIDADLVQDFTFDFDNTSHLLKIGADVYVDKKNTFSFYATFNESDNFSKGSTKITKDGILETNSPTLTTKENGSQDYNFNYTLDFDKEGENLELEANISTNKNPEILFAKELIRANDLINNYPNNVVNKRDTRLFNLDYTNPISENSKVELGLEARFTSTSNDLNTGQHEFIYDNSNNRILDPLGTGWYDGQWYKTKERDNSSFDYDRKIYSAYINYNQQFDKLGMQLGARLEQYEVTGKFNSGAQLVPYSDKIFSIYPSAFFTYSSSDKNQFQLSYSRRVDRPSIGQVNPIREWSTPLITSVGNPELKPQFTNSYELNYTHQYSKGSVTFGTFFRDVNDNISRILNKDPLDVDRVELSYINSTASNRYGVELSSNHAFQNWWRVNASMDLYIQKESGISDGALLEVTNNAFNARINNSFTATKNLRFQLFAMYRGGGQSIQFKVDPMWMINTGASLNVLKGKGTISLNVNDIFKGMKFKFNSQSPIKQEGQFNWESRTAYLGFMYRFGGGKNQAKRRKQRDANETQGSGGFI
jgi:outer membrane receptor protein involved in Fe transport